MPLIYHSSQTDLIVHVQLLSKKSYDIYIKYVMTYKHELIIRRFKMKKSILFIILIAALSLTMSVNGAYAFGQAGSSGSPKMAAPGGASSLSGKVLETMNSGGYTYVNIEKDGKTSWVAVPSTTVTVGQEIAFQPGMPMTNFTSKSLGRTFNSIIFSGGTAGPQSILSNHSAPSPAPAPAAAASTAPAAPIKVDKAAGADAYTVSELYEKIATLSTKTVVFKGQVVKFSPNIMKKNWLHIQDGSGDSSKGTNDMLVTSMDQASIGDVVTVKGTLSKDKDFGSGYKYAVIVEEASITK